MDRTTRAVQRLWGSAGPGHLPPAARFADELATHVNGKLALTAPRVTKWTYGQQVEHLYKSSHYVLDRLAEAMSGRDADQRMGFWGAGLMVGGFIPRGFFPTIPQLEPGAGTIAEITPLKDSLEQRLRSIDWGMNEVWASPGKSRHPRMKFLNTAQWLFFADIHHRHHISILRDMVKAAS